LVTDQANSSLEPKSADLPPESLFVTTFLWKDSAPSDNQVRLRVPGQHCGEGADRDILALNGIEPPDHSDRFPPDIGLHPVY
jgi:hypothetical protein